MKSLRKNAPEEVELEKKCVYCERATSLAADDEHMLCKKYGIVECDHVCRRFSYDPLKRVPVQPRVIHLDPACFDPD